VSFAPRVEVERSQLPDDDREAFDGAIRLVRADVTLAWEPYGVGDRWFATGCGGGVKIVARWLTGEQARTRYGDGVERALLIARILVIAPGG
jgi:hypothetical protein